MESNHFVPCSCQSHLLQVQRYKWDDVDEGFNFVIWFRDRKDGTLSWKDRFRWCWQIISKGTPWADHIIATNETAKGVAKYILEELDSSEQEKK